MIEMNDMRATGCIAAKVGNLVVGEQFGHPAPILSESNRFSVGQSYVIPESRG